MTDLAIKKLEDEEHHFSGDKYAKAVYHAVADKLRDFCRQDEEFAQAVYQNGKTLSDCCAAAMKGCGSSISDVEVYSKAVAFYFRGATIRVQMKIDLCGDVAAQEDKPAKNAIVVDLFDLL